MKCIQSVTGTIRRVSNEAAKHAVESLGVATYCLKSKWKAEVRDVDKEPIEALVDTETERSPELITEPPKKNKASHATRRQRKQR